MTFDVATISIGLGIISTIGGGLWQISRTIAVKDEQNMARHAATEQALRDSIVQSSRRHQQSEASIGNMAASVQSLADTVSRMAQANTGDHATMKTQIEAHEKVIDRMISRLEEIR